MRFCSNYQKFDLELLSGYNKAIKISISFDKKKSDSNKEIGQHQYITTVYSFFTHSCAIFFIPWSNGTFVFFTNFITS